MEISYPFRINNRGRTATVDFEGHIRDMVHQVLFTMPGERVNRPDFGSGLMQLAFSPGSDELTAATQFLVQGSLQQWLGELIQVEAVEVESDESALLVTIRYMIRQSQEQKTAQFSYEV